MNNSVLAKMAVIISANAAEFNKTLKSTQNGLSKFTGMIGKGFAAAGIAMGTKELLEAGFAAAKLAGQAQGVRTAFERLPDSVHLLEDLKEATHGTVSELELMKRAVQASNFDIELSALPKLLEFATLRAQQTGQSVDYLVDSIVTGIGRKSKLILDNLGISAVALNEKLKGVSTEAATVGDVARAVGDIAEESLGKMAKFSENTDSKTQRLTASWENLKVAMGDAINSSGLPKFLDLLTGVVNKMADAGKITKESVQAQVTAFNNLAKAGYNTSEQLKTVQFFAKKAGVELVLMTDAVSGVTKLLIDPRSKPIWIVDQITKAIITLETLKDKQKEANEAFEKTSIKDSKALRLLALENAGLDEKIKKLERIKKLVSEEEVIKREPGQANKKALIGDGGLINMSAVNEYLDAMQRMLQASLKTSQGIKKSFEMDLGPAISGVVANIAQAIGEASTGATKFGESVLNIIGGFMQQFGAALIATGIGEIAFKSFSGPAMIAAGVALVAAGAALSATVNNRPDLSGGSSGGSSASGRSTNDSFTRSGFEIQVGGEWRIRGADLVYIVNRQQQLNGRTN